MLEHEEERVRWLLVILQSVKLAHVKLRNPSFYNVNCLHRKSLSLPEGIRLGEERIHRILHLNLIK